MHRFSLLQATATGAAFVLRQRGGAATCTAWVATTTVPSTAAFFPAAKAPPPQVRAFHRCFHNNRRHRLLRKTNHHRRRGASRMMGRGPSTMMGRGASLPHTTPSRPMSTRDEDGGGRREGTSDPSASPRLLQTALPSDLLLGEDETVKTISVSVGPHLDDARVTTTSSDVESEIQDVEGHEEAGDLDHRDPRLPAVGHDRRRIVHFNNAGASPSPPVVLSAVMTHLANEATLGGYLAAELHREELDDVYASVARLINAPSADADSGLCPMDEIALVESATVAWTRVFYAMAEGRVAAGEIMLCCEAEYAANIVAMRQFAERRDAQVMAVPSISNTGIVDLDAFRRILGDPNVGPRVALVCITHIPTNSGIVNPVEEIGEIIDQFNEIQRTSEERGDEGRGSRRREEVLFLVDACQSVGQMVVDVRRIKCDALTATGRKYLRGPRGTGFLYVRHDVADSLVPSHVDHAAAPVIAVPDQPGPRPMGAGYCDGGSIDVDVAFRYREGARRFEFWEYSVADRLGLGAAVDHAMDVAGLDVIERRCSELGSELRRRLRAKVPGVRIHHDCVDDDGDEVEDGGTKTQRRCCGIVTFDVDGMEPQDVVEAMLRERGFALSFVPATSTPLDSSASGCGDLVRASLTYFNTIEEINSFCDALVRIVGEANGGTP